MTATDDCDPSRTETETMGLSASRIFKTAALLVLASAFLNNTASAQPTNLSRTSAGYTYFNRPGANIEIHDAELTDCIRTVAPATPIRAEPDFANLLASTMYQSAAYNMFLGNIENCMVVRGWRVVRLSDTAGAEFSRQNHGYKLKLLSSWVGAEVPSNQLSRIWNNDATRAETIKGIITYIGPPLSLSLVTLADSPPQAAEPPPRKPASDWFKRQVKPITSTQLKAASPEAAFVVIRVSGTGRQNGQYLGFHRLGRDLTNNAWYEDGQLDRFNASLRYTLIAGSSSELRHSDLVAALPPGTWRLNEMLGPTDFCLGAPTFEIKAGEVLFLGSFDLGSDQLTPVEDLQLAHQVLSENPTLDARVHAVSWVNRGPISCSPLLVYALEFPGAPYEPGFRRGWPAANNSVDGQSAPGPR